LREVIEHYLPELAKGECVQGDADALVSRLLGQGDVLDWSPYLLESASRYAVTTAGGDEDAGKAERRQHSDERKALNRWRQQHGGKNPVAKAAAAEARGQEQALRGLARERADRKRIEKLGYRDGKNHEVEKVVMKKCLLYLRETGKLPDQLGEVW